MEKPTKATSFIKQSDYSHETDTRPMSYHQKIAAPSSAPKSVVGVNPAFIRNTMTTLVMDENWSVAGDDFDIIDTKGVPIVSCKGRYFSMRRRKGKSATHHRPCERFQVLRPSKTWLTIAPTSLHNTTGRRTLHTAQTTLFDPAMLLSPKTLRRASPAHPWALDIRESEAGCRVQECLGEWSGCGFRGAGELSREGG